jgi:protease PrsW
MRGAELEAAYPFLGVLPGVAWLAYFYYKGRHRPDSSAHILRVFLWGCACTLPTMLVELYTNMGLLRGTILGSGPLSACLVGPIEEFFKLAAVWFAIYRDPDFREPIHGIIYATTAALGFASVENILYLRQLGPSDLWSRVMFATPGHVMFSSMWGYSMGLARFRRSGELTTILKGFLMGATFHGVYNLVVELHPGTAMITLIPLMLFMGWIMNRRVREFHRQFPFPDLGEGALILCPHCGAYTLEQAERCTRCDVAVPRVAMDTPRFCGRCRARLDPCATKCHRCGASIDSSDQCSPVR